MGTWTLQSIAHKKAFHDTNELYGNHYIVDFKLRYAKARFGNYKETPRLYWNELIMMKDLAVREHWSFAANMYEHNPLSKTLQVWAMRYVCAYKTAANNRDLTVKGSSTLVDTRGQPVSIDKIGRNINNKAEQADAVRSYLKRHGGGLDIQIDDIPSLSLSSEQVHKERLLIFNCGVVDGGPRTQAIQYLNVDPALPRAQWTRRFDLAWTMKAMNTLGFKKVPPPNIVSNPRTPLFGTGECW